MKRLRIERFGLDALRLENAPLPVPGPGQALVRVKAAGLNPSDYTNVKGGFQQTTLPCTPGRDYAGVVEDGPEDWAGAEVWGSGAELGFTRDGTHAEFVSVPAGSLVRKPKNLSFAAAAGAGVPYIAAYMALFDAAELREGESLLIIGAAGAVGRAAAQLAHWNNATVIGADRDTGDVSALVREQTAGGGVDVCLDAVGGPMFNVALASLALRGRLAVLTAKADGKVTFDVRDFYHRELRMAGVDTLKMGAVESAAIHRKLTPLFESGAIAADEPERVRIEDAIAAYRRLGAGSAPKMALVFE